MEFAVVTTASEVVERGDAEGQRGCCGPAERRPKQRTTARATTGQHSGTAGQQPATTARYRGRDGG